MSLLLPRGSARFTFAADDGIVVVRSRRDESVVSREISLALRERLGPDGTLGLLALFEATRKEWATGVTENAADRFDRKLTAEISQLRVELKHELHDLRVELKGDINHLDGSVKDALLHQTRWMFGMWVGQLAATAAIVAAMFRIYSP